MPLYAVALLVNAAHAQASTEIPEYNLTVTIAEADEDDLTRVVTNMEIINWGTSETPPRARCLYLPYNTPDYDFDPARNFDLLPQRYAKSTPRSGSSVVTIATPGITQEWVEPYLLKLTSPEPIQRLQLTIDSTPPRWPDADNDEWFYADFFGSPLAECPDDSDNYRSFKTIDRAAIRGTLNFPVNWQVASNAVSGPVASTVEKRLQAPLRLEAGKFAFALARHYHHVVEQMEGVTVEIFHRTDEFLAIQSSLRLGMQQHVRLFGRFPFEKLVLVETAELERSALPGMIALNRPHQPGLDKVQKDILNWSQWQLTTFLAEQWFGASISTSLDDFWLLRGFAEFAAGIALLSDPDTHDLFADGAKISGKLSFTYRQMQDLVAAALTYLQPENALTTNNGVSKDAFADQHALSYIRHSLALRQLYWSLGEENFRSMLASFAEKNQFRRITPELFLRHLRQQVTKKDDLASAGEMLLWWWTTDKWPDFYIHDVNSVVEKSASKPERWRTRIEVASSGDFRFPVDVVAVDRQGHKVRGTTKSTAKPTLATVEFLSDSPIDRVIIDPDEKTFDWNRFDNNNAWPKVYFLPGGAKSFPSDAYTVFWLPLFSKLPGEPFTLLLAAQGFKYIHSAFTGILSYVPSEDRLGGSWSYLADFPQIGGYTVAEVIQDHGLSTRGERIMQVGFYKMPFLIREPSLELGIQVRNRQTLGDPESMHQVVSLRSMLVPLNSYGPCKYFLKSDYEYAVPSDHNAIDYRRFTFFGDTSCRIFSGLDMGLRLFRGSLDVRGEAPENTYFIPQNLKEARLRIDSPLLENVSAVTSLGVDALVPFGLPLPDSLYILKRDARWRLFYDLGRTSAPDGRFADAGFGVSLPFGGDLVGKGSISVLNFSALVVLFRDIDGVKSTNPGVLFDFDFFGKL